MKRNKIAATLLAMTAATAAWAGKAEDDANARELGAAVQENMLMTYSCQKYLGMEQYRAAKFLAVQIFTRASGDRNKAVLMMDGAEQNIKKTKADTRLEASFEERQLSYIDRVEMCQELTAEVMDRIQLLHAKLGLF